MLYDLYAREIEDIITQAVEQSHKIMAELKSKPTGEEISITCRCELTIRRSEDGSYKVTVSPQMSDVDNIEKHELEEMLTELEIVKD